MRCVFAFSVAPSLARTFGAGVLLLLSGAHFFVVLAAAGFGVYVLTKYQQPTYQPPTTNNRQTNNKQTTLKHSLVTIGVDWRPFCYKRGSCEYYADPWFSGMPLRRCEPNFPLGEVGKATMIWFALQWVPMLIYVIVVDMQLKDLLVPRGGGGVVIAARPSAVVAATPPTTGSCCVRYLRYVCMYDPPCTGVSRQVACSSCGVQLKYVETGAVTTVQCHACRAILELRTVG